MAHIKKILKKKKSSWKQPKCPSTDERINKIWSTHTREYYSAVKRNEILIYATTWVDSENIMLSDTNQTQECKCHIIPLTRGT